MGGNSYASKYLVEFGQRNIRNKVSFKLLEGRLGPEYTFNYFSSSF